MDFPSHNMQVQMHQSNSCDYQTIPSNIVMQKTAIQIFEAGLDTQNQVITVKSRKIGDVQQFLSSIISFQYTTKDHCEINGVNKNFLSF